MSTVPVVQEAITAESLEAKIETLDAAYRSFKLDVQAEIRLCRTDRRGQRSLFASLSGVADPIAIRTPLLDRNGYKEVKSP